MNAKLVFIRNRTIYSCFDHGKDSCPKPLRSSVVYSFRCECGEEYIGETMRNLADRMKEYFSSSSSAIFVHISQCSSYYPSCPRQLMNNVKIIIPTHTLYVDS